MKDWIKWIGAMLLMLACFYGLPFVASSLWTDAEGATRTLKAAGYSDIEITGYRPFMGDDWYSTGFRATSPGGQEVTGAVTGGFLKGNTIRTD